MQIEIPRRRVMLEAVARGIASSNVDTVIASLGLLAAMRAHPAFEHSLGGALKADEVMALVTDQLSVADAEEIFGAGRAEVAGTENTPINAMAAFLEAMKHGPALVLQVRPEE